MSDGARQGEIATKRFPHLSSCGGCAVRNGGESVAVFTKTLVSVVEDCEQQEMRQRKWRGKIKL